MNEKPILFSGEMVKAILDGRKTQTRRVVKGIEFVGSKGTQDDPESWGIEDKYGDYYTLPINGNTSKDFKIQCPYGEIGDQLWVRETFTIESNWNLESEEYYPPPFKDGRPVRRETHPEYGSYWEQCHYRASDPAPELSYDDMEEPGCRWKPSIHMPRWASRINLEITDIRVEQLQDISRDDAKAEGITEYLSEFSSDQHTEAEDDEWRNRTTIENFHGLWNSINGKPRADGVDISWGANPWVWIPEFRIIK